MGTFLSILVSTGFISLVSFSGALFLFFQKHLVQRISLFLLAFAAGSFMGAAFLHLLPEAVEQVESANSFLFILLGFGLFFFIENIFHWHHVRNDEPEHKSLGMLTLLGDGVHNFLDGMIIAAVFFVDIKLGFAATLAVALHEIPQEIAEFGVLIHAGYSRMRALLFNFLSASTVIAGGILSFFLEAWLGQWIALFMLFAAGVFIYVAASDFVPEMRKERNFSKSISLLATFAAGVFLMWLVLFLE
ncbi:MAG TPA: ZIP family metal transporter [Candidatus Paceibacterota bacterium]